MPTSIASIAVVVRGLLVPGIDVINLCKPNSASTPGGAISKDAK
jgi:hypothetical protein